MPIDKVSDLKWSILHNHVLLVATYNNYKVKKLINTHWS